MNKKKVLIYAGLIALIICSYVAYSLYYNILSPNVSRDGVIYVTENDTPTSISQRLFADSIIKDTVSFNWIIKKKRFRHVKTGKYVIKKGTNNNTLINRLRIGDQTPIALTFNNIRTKEDFSGRISDVLNIDSLDILNHMNDSDYTAKFGFNTNTIIAMFVPNSYQMFWNTDVDSFFNKMNLEYKKFWTKSRLRKAKLANLTPIGVITIASIVEEETVKKEELSKIAGVYINRLRRNIALSACPTLKFAIGDFNIHRILNKHKKIDSPYNTYKYRGLPPGPIRQASINVIDAVLNYDKHKYLYFCARYDFSGYHYFSKTLHQHNLYAEKYRKELNKRRIYR